MQHSGKICVVGGTELARTIAHRRRRKSLPRSACSGVCCACGHHRVSIQPFARMACRSHSANQLRTIPHMLPSHRIATQLPLPFAPHDTELWIQFELSSSCVHMRHLCSVRVSRTAHITKTHPIPPLGVENR
ncbi:uncharacterized protein LAESUDRAFT_511466 [Laetiporus sulphureus 93-53]|uniref:Uncharacterized protein n=1 Tax=Laetiporus sulphureus 93-53 TaxID=1314785 RepID=A0A165FY25_9APHY|nr:uncharacterized protein LAESUDRAFT_511466 [Laetiporus sulphureus 93-53]KZT09568.1 hypothetical protein LAESUDRAFT_511466 [Laetiporus sulphureus 93-53]